MAASDSGMRQLLAGASVDADRPAIRRTTDPTGPRATVEPSVTTVPDIPVVQLPAFEEDSAVGSPTASMWAVDVPTARRPSPLTLAVLGVLAGIAAMVLGAAAVISAGGASQNVLRTCRRHDARPARPTLPALSDGFSRSSRNRVPSGSSFGGRADSSSQSEAAAERRSCFAASNAPHQASPTGRGSSRRAPSRSRAARFVGTERAVFLSGTSAPETARHRLEPSAGWGATSERPLRRRARVDV